MRSEQKSPSLHLPASFGVAAGLAKAEEDAPSGSSTSDCLPSASACFSSSSLASLPSRRLSWVLIPETGVSRLEISSSIVFCRGVCVSPVKLQPHRDSDIIVVWHFHSFSWGKKDGFYAQSERKKPLLAFALCKIEEDALPHISHFVNWGLLKVSTVAEVEKEIQKVFETNIYLVPTGKNIWKSEGTFVISIRKVDMSIVPLNCLIPYWLVKKDLRFDPITFNFSENSNYWQERCKGKTLLDVVNKLLNTLSLFLMPKHVLSLHLKQTFPPIIWIFTEGVGDGIESRLPSKIFSTLT